MTIITLGQYATKCASQTATTGDLHSMGERERGGRVRKRIVLLSLPERLMLMLAATPGMPIFLVDCCCACCWPAIPDLVLKRGGGEGGGGGLPGQLPRHWKPWRSFWQTIRIGPDSWLDGFFNVWKVGRPSYLLFPLFQHGPTRLMNNIEDSPILIFPRAI